MLTRDTMLKIIKMLVVIVFSATILLSMKTVASETKIVDNSKTRHSVMYKDGKRSSGYYSAVTGNITYKDASGRVVQKCTIKNNERVCR